MEPPVRARRLDGTVRQRRQSGAVSVPDQVAVEIIDTRVDAHEAVHAWRGFSGSQARVDRIDVLKQSKKTAVYRLHAAMRGGTAVIAKRRLHEAIAYERMIYERVLSVLPVSSLVCYGSLTGDADTSWIFLEDSGGTEVSYQTASHTTAATNWLAAAHVAASTRAKGAQLPDRGPQHYLRHLRNARQTLGRCISSPALDAEEAALLSDVIARLDILEKRWPDVEAFCALFPRTFAHGDFVKKNVHVRELRGETIVLPFDWETSGWGVPAADLTRVDIDLYWSIVRDGWPSLSLRDARRMATLGTVFCLLAAISWEAPSFRASWVKRAAMKMALYSERLALAMDAWGLT